ncbi:blue light receptor [Tulasnella sp. 419]|nr:blue light receptor [Tulasnella sp. 419]
MNELPGTIILVLSNSGKVLFYGEAAKELLGWKDDVVNSQITDLLHSEDEAAFVTHFNTCLMTRTELSIFVRLRSDLPLSPGTTQWPMFEVKGHPYFSPNGDTIDCKCVFAAARPYPSRNTEVLDSFLELKVENERLRERLLELRSPNATHFSVNPVFANSSASDYPSLNGQSSGLPNDPEMGYQLPSMHNLPMSHSRRTSEVTFQPAGSSSTLDGGEASNGATTRQRKGTSGTITEMDEDDATVRRRKRKAQNNEHQYVCVTCGRTDSPEWRKGPLGPKTLCNACGLRHSKRTKKKVDDDPSPPEPSTTQQTPQAQQQQQQAQQQHPPQSLQHSQPSLHPTGRDYLPASGYSNIGAVAFNNHNVPQPGGPILSQIQTQFSFSSGDEMTSSAASMHYPMSSRSDRIDNMLPGDYRLRPADT